MLCQLPKWAHCGAIDDHPSTYDDVNVNNFLSSHNNNTNTAYVWRMVEMILPGNQCTKASDIQIYKCPFNVFRLLSLKLTD